MVALLVSYSNVETGSFRKSNKLQLLFPKAYVLGVFMYPFDVIKALDKHNN